MTKQDGRRPHETQPSLHYQYHQERGHTTKNCRILWNHLKQLIRDGRLKWFLYQPTGQWDQAGSGARENASLRPPLGTINVIFATPGWIDSHPSKVISVVWLPVEDSNSEPKKAKVEIWPALSFSDEDKVETIQPNDDALVVTLKIEGYDVKRVLVDQGRGAKIMYPDLYKGLNLRLEDLTAYDSPLVSFDGKVIIPRG